MKPNTPMGLVPRPILQIIVPPYLVKLFPEIEIWIFTIKPIERYR
ncbi:hypothetical protein NIES932_03640 [Raphidiopsis curvata NIES-932]|nr:hypothetical protein NIES932_03640 [Raphidiopsis curvata NIES-932]